MKKLIITILTVFILKASFGQTVNSSDLTIFKPKTLDTTVIRFDSANIYGALRALRLPIRDNNWTPPTSGFIEFSPTQSALYYYNTDSAKWLLVGGGTGGSPPSLATLSPGYGIIGVTYDPYSTNQTWSVDTSAAGLATYYYVNNYFPTDSVFAANFIVDSITNTPPASPVDSSYVLVGTSPTGVFVSHVNQVAQRIGSGWSYTVPSVNDKLIDAANDVIYVWNGTAWVATAVPVLNNGNPQNVNVNIQPYKTKNLNLRIKGTNIIQLNTSKQIVFPAFTDTSTDYTVQLIYNKDHVDTVHARNLYAVTPLRLSNDTLYCDSCGGGSGGSETWEQTLTNQGSTPFTTDNTVDFGNKNLIFSNPYLFYSQSAADVNNGVDSFKTTILSEPYLAFLQMYSYGVGNNYMGQSDIQVDADPYGLGNDTTFGIRLSNANKISNDNSLYITRLGFDFNTSYPSLLVKMKGLDSSDANPNNIAWFDADNILHRGHIDAGSSGSPTGSAGGDLGSTYPNPTVTGLNGVAMSISGLATGNFLKYNGTNWINTSLSSSDIPSLDMSKITTGNLNWSRISSTPTTLSGYGITDAQSALSDAANIVYKDVGNSYTAGAKQNFQGNSVYAAINFTGVSSNPSSLVNGDVWYRVDETKLHYYDGTADRKIVAETLAQTLLNKTISASSNTISGIGASNMTYGSYSFVANNTNASATPTSFVYEDLGEQTYSGTISNFVATSNPSSPSAVYHWTQIGKTVNVWFWLVFGTAGSAVQGFTATIPSDIPNPIERGGYTSVGDIEAIGVANSGGTSSTINTGGKIVIAKTGTGTYQWAFVLNSNTGKYIQAHMTYQTP